MFRDIQDDRKITIEQDCTKLKHINDIMFWVPYFLFWGLVSTKPSVRML